MFCSRSCRAKVHAARLIPFAGNMKGRKRKDARYGAGNPAWKGGATYRRPQGNYKGARSVRCPPNLPTMAMANGYIMEHRLVMARWIKRPLQRTECVHHIDHDPRNNVRGNLELWPSNSAHKAWEHGRIVLGAANRVFLMG